MPNAWRGFAIPILNPCMTHASAFVFRINPGGRSGRVCHDPVPHILHQTLMFMAVCIWISEFGLIQQVHFIKIRLIICFIDDHVGIHLILVVYGFPEAGQEGFEKNRIQMGSD